MANKTKEFDPQNTLFFEEVEPRILLSANLEGLFFDADSAADSGTSELDVVLPTDTLTTDIYSSQTEPTHELIIIDSRVPDIEQLLNDIQAQQPEGRTFDVLILNAEQSGVEQIQQIMGDYEDLDAIHVISHSDSDSILLGNEELNNNNIENYKEVLGQWGDALNETADILIYGCELASSDAGINLIEKIQNFTGADVAASDDLTGNEELGGDWDLEHKAGDIETNIAFGDELQQSWNGVLGGGGHGSNPTISNLGNITYTEDSGAITIDQGTAASVSDGGMMNSFSTGSLTISFTAGSTGSEDELSLDVSGNFSLSGTDLKYGSTVIGTVTASGGSGGGNLAFSFDSDATESIVGELIQNIQYENTNTGNPSGTSRDLDFVLENDAGNTVTQSVSIAITTTNDAATISGTPSTSVAEDSAYSFTPTSNDDDGDSLTFSIANKPSWATFDTGTGELSGTPDNGDVGTYSSIVITVDDGTTTTDLASFNVEVTNTNDAATISGTPATTIAEDSAYSFTPTSNDDDGDSLTFSIANKPSWATFDTATGELSGTPDNGDVGTYSSIVITVDDGTVTTDLASFNVEVTNTNDAATISGTPATTIAEDSAYSFTPTSNDVDGDSLTFSIANKPSWATFDTSTGELSGTPANGDVGTYSSIVITVDDGTTTTDLASFDITVSAANNSPTVANAISDQSTAEDASYSYTFDSNTFNDADGDAITYTATLSDGSALPTWLSFDTGTREFSGSPANGDVGTITIKVTATDTSSASVSDSFDLTVTNTNDAATISGTLSTSVAEDSAYSFTPTANDVDGDSLTFSIANKPSWATFDTGTGELSGTPDNGDVGTYSSIVITVDDGTVTTDLASFDVTVTNTNDAATISGTPSTSVAEDSAYSFVPTTNDDDGDSLTFSIANKPSWATFDTGTGELSGTPDNGDVGTTSNIVITVDDGTTMTDLASFNVEVTNTNNEATSSPDTMSNGSTVSTPSISEPEKNSNTSNKNTDDVTSAQDDTAEELIMYPQDIEPSANVIKSGAHTIQSINSLDNAGSFDAHELPYNVQNIENPFSFEFKAENNSIQIYTHDNSQDTLQLALEQALNTFDKELAEAFAEDSVNHTIVINTAAGASIALTAGVVTMVLKSSSLLASLASIIPTWNSFDPLPILEIANHSKTLKADNEKDLVDNVFDANNAALNELK